MSLEFNFQELGNISDIKGGKRLPKGHNLINIPNSHPYIKVKDMSQDKLLKLTNDFEYIEKDTYDEISQYIVKKDDLIISIVGTIGLTNIIDYSLDNANLTENCAKITNLNDEYNIEYIYYFLNSMIGQNLVHEATVGAVQKKLPIKNIRSLNIPFPNLDIQNKIVKVLSDIDKKIETNKRINKNLLKLSRALFKEFYMDKVESYDIKKYVTLDEVTSKFATGLNPRKNFVLGEGDNYYVTIKNMANNSIVLDDKCASITDEALVKINKRSDLQVGDLLFSGIGTIGRVHLIDEKPTNWNISESVFTMRPNELVSSEFLFIMLLSQEVQEYAKSLASGSVQKGIRMRDLKAFEFILLDEEDKSFLDSLLIPVIADIKSNEKEIIKLTKLRDTLLPKLMSGEIDVSKINCDDFLFVKIIHITTLILRYLIEEII